MSNEDSVFLFNSLGRHCSINKLHVIFRRLHPQSLGNLGVSLRIEQQVKKKHRNMKLFSQVIKFGEVQTAFHKI